MFVFLRVSARARSGGHQYSPEGSERGIATAVPDKNDTVKVYCNAGASQGRQKRSLARWDIPTLRTRWPERHRNAEGQRLKESTLTALMRRLLFLSHLMYIPIDYCVSSQIRFFPGKK